MSIDAVHAAFEAAKFAIDEALRERDEALRRVEELEQERDFWRKTLHDFNAALAADQGSAE